jgi:hypothetical protein
MSTLVTLGRVSEETRGSVYTANHHDSGAAKKTMDGITFYRSGPVGSPDQVSEANRIVDLA